VQYVGSLPEGTLFAPTRDGEPRAINFGSGKDSLSIVNANFDIPLLISSLIK
jgi:hypothetical protein